MSSISFPDTTDGWYRLKIAQVEHLRNAVLSANLNATQIGGPPVQGSLAFATGKGIIFSSGFIQGKVALAGGLSEDAVGLYLLLQCGTASRLWLNPASDGDLVVLQPGQALDILHAGRSMYVSATILKRVLQQIVDREGASLSGHILNTTGIYRVPPDDLAGLKARFLGIHRTNSDDDNQKSAGAAFLRAVIQNLPGMSKDQCRPAEPVGRAKIVARAQVHIKRNLSTFLSMDEITAAAETSRRTLFRSFVDVLNETPGNYATRLRLNRIRADLMAGNGTIDVITARWGIGEPGRMSGRYRELFGENPSDTVAASLIGRRNLDFF
jgi:AraC-like DNA-binding protein